MSRAVVIGLARTGEVVARVLAAEGHDVLVVDRRDDERVRARAAALPENVTVQLGGYADDVAAGAAFVSPSPGVRWDAPELEWARAHGIAVRSEMAMVFERVRSRVVGITGTNGKTTTTALVASILERGSDRVVLGGNIGAPVLDRIADLQAADWLVLELSSFQIETVEAPRCTVACVLNVTPDHLDRHGSFEAYTALKERIVRHASSAVVLGYDDPVTRAMAASAHCDVRFFGTGIDAYDGATLRDEHVVAVDGGVAAEVMRVDEIPLFGAHNVLNVLAALAVGRVGGIGPVRIADAVRAFRAVPHRLEVVLEHDGVTWVNDSKATNADSAIVALRAFSGRPIIWIGGGDSATPVAPELVAEVASRARIAVVNGATAEDLDRELEHRGFSSRIRVRTLAEAVDAARSAARSGDVVLLAPGHKSFDQFDDFEHRGDVFRELVRAGAPASVRGG